MTKQIKCASCEEPIEDFENAGFYGDEGTKYEGKPICETCYFEDEPAATLKAYSYPRFEFSDQEEYAGIISSTRNETNGEFKTKWIKTDAWRGYYEIETKGWKRLLDDNILAYSEDAENLKNLDQIVCEYLNQEGIPHVKAFTRSSNIFSTGYNLFVPEWVNVEEIAEALDLNSLKRGLRDPDNYYSTALTGADPKDQTETDKLFVKASKKITGLETDEDLKNIIKATKKEYTNV